MIDKKHKPLIQLLGKDVLQSSEALAKQLNVSAATVRRRLRKLRNNGIVRAVACVNPSDIGQPLGAVIALGVPNEKVDSVARTLSERPEVKWVATTTGRFDIMVFACFPSTDELARFLQNELPKDSIRDSETFICLHTYDGYYTPM